MAPNLNIPSSSSTVTIRMIDTTGYGTVAADMVFKPPVRGRTVGHFPCFSFLITNRQTNEHVIYDVGVRKDWRTGYPPAMYRLLGDSALMKVHVEKDIKDILETDNNFPLSNISKCIWSHHHFDHRGDMSLFPSSTKLIIGPGTLAAYPTYPGDENSDLHEDQLSGREVHELSQRDLALTIGDYPSYDLFGDGSFYLLFSPGHTAGHLSGLARVTSNPDTFVLLGGDCCHHPAQFRPSPLSPLPDKITFQPNAVAFTDALVPDPPHKTTRQVTTCPGSYIEQSLHPNNRNDAPFYDLVHEPINHNYAHAIESRDKMMAFDADPNILVIIAHDASVMGILPFYPESLNQWKERDLKNVLDKGRWEFLSDFDLGGGED